MAEAQKKQPPQETQEKQLTLMQTKMISLRQFVKEHDLRKHLEPLLPAHLNADRFIAAAFALVTRTPDLLMCSPSSFVGAIVQSALCGLEPKGAGGTWLVEFKGKVQMIADYRGLILLGLQHPSIASIDAQVVHEKDTFDMSLGTNAHIIHVPFQGEEDPGKLRMAYMIAYLKESTHPIIEPMSLYQINRIKARSKSGAKNVGPWITDFDKMARKSVIRSGFALLPQSPGVEKALRFDRDAIAIPQRGEDPEVEDVLRDMDITDIQEGGNAEALKEAINQTL